MGLYLSSISFCVTLSPQFFSLKSGVSAWPSLASPVETTSWQGPGGKSKFVKYRHGPRRWHRQRWSERKGYFAWGIYVWRSHEQDHQDNWDSLRGWNIRSSSMTLIYCKCSSERVVHSWDWWVRRTLVVNVNKNTWERQQAQPFVVQWHDEQGFFFSSACGAGSAI